MYCANVTRGSRVRIVLLRRSYYHRSSAALKLQHHQRARPSTALVRKFGRSRTLTIFTPSFLHINNINIINIRNPTLTGGGEFGGARGNEGDMLFCKVRQINYDCAGEQVLTGAGELWGGALGIEVPSSRVTGQLHTIKYHKRKEEVIQSCH